MKRIFVALDSSERSKQVLNAAARLAELTDSKLILYRAIYVSPDSVNEARLATNEVVVEDVLRRNAHAGLDSLAATLRAGLVEELVVEVATPWDGNCRDARTRDADLIVIGSHGFGGIDHLLGTTAAKVVNHADRNVLVVRTLL